jgi:hypothetical protein
LKGGAVSQQKKIWLLVATVWPIFYTLCFVIVAFSLVFSMLPQGETPPPTPAWVFAIFPIHLLTILLCLGLLVIYIIHVVKANVVPKQQRTLWIILLVLGGVIAMIVYWVLYIWRTPKSIS